MLKLIIMNLMAYKMNLSRDKYYSVKECIKKLNKMYNVKLTDRDIHLLLQPYGLKPVKHRSGYQMYQKSSFEELIKGPKYKDIEKKAKELNDINNIKNNDDKPKINNKNKINNKPNNNKSLNLFSNDIEDTKNNFTMDDFDSYEYNPKIDDLEYKDNENDMEKYSKHLIDKYQFESVKTIIVNENKLNKLINYLLK